MKSIIVSTFIFTFLIIYSCFAGNTQSSVIDKDDLVKQIKILKGLEKTKAVDSYDGIPLKSGSRLGFALLSLENEIEPALFKILIERPVRQTSIDTDHFRIHYDTEGDHAVPLLDVFPEGPNGIPDYVDSTALILD